MLGGQQVPTSWGFFLLASPEGDGGERRWPSPFLSPQICLQTQYCGEIFPFEKKISPVASFEGIWCVSRRELYVSARRHSRGFCSRGPRDLGGAGAAAAGGEGSGDWRKAHAALPASSFCKKSLARPTNTRLTFFFRIHFGMVRAEVCASSTSR